MFIRSICFRIYEIVIIFSLQQSVVQMCFKDLLLTDLNLINLAKLDLYPFYNEIFMFKFNFFFEIFQFIFFDS